MPAVARKKKEPALQAPSFFLSLHYFPPNILAYSLSCTWSVKNFG